jgi:hypothetical protein
MLILVAPRSRPASFIASHHKLLDKSRIGGISPVKFRVVLREVEGSPGGRGLCRDVNPMSAQTTTIRERAPLLLVFGSLADRVAEILRARPSLTARIAFAPPEAIHAIAAFLYLAPEAAGSDAEVGNLIEQSDPRELLKKAIPDCPTRLYRALDRAGSPVHNRSYYVRLDAVCRGPFGSAFLDGDLNDTRLDFYDALGAMDPLVASLYVALPETRHLANAVDTLVALIRSFGAIEACDFNLPKNARIGAVLRRLLRGLYAVRAPQPPFAVPATLRLVETIGELQEIGRRFKNCLAQTATYGTNYWFDLANGSVVYLTTEEPPLIIALRKVGPDLWHIDQLAGPKDMLPSDGSRRSMEQKLKDAGIKLVALNPGYALSNLDQATRQPKTGANIDDLDDMLHDLDN